MYDEVETPRALRPKPRGLAAGKAVVALNDLERRKVAAVRDTEALLALYNEEIEKVTNKLKQTGKFKIGLDSNSEAYAPVNKKFDKLAAEIFAKYNLPPGTKLKLW